MVTRRTSTRTRLLLLLFALLASASMVQSVLIDRYWLVKFQDLEEEQVWGNMRLIHLWFDRFLQPLENQARAAGTWQRAESFEIARRADRSIQNADFDVAALYSVDGALRFAKAFDRKLGEEVPVSATLLPLLDLHLKASRGDDRRLISGWSSISGAMIATASYPVELDDGDAQEGFYVVGRFMGPDELNVLGELSGTSIALVSPERLERDSAEGFSAELSSGELSRVRTKGGGLQACRRLSRDLNPDPQLMCLSLRDSIFERGRQSVMQMWAVTLAGFFLLVAGAWIFIDRQILNRLQRMSGQLERSQTDTRDLEALLRNDSLEADELGAMSQGLHDLLGQVRLSQVDLKRQEKTFRALTESARVGIVVHRDTVTYANPHAESLFNRSDAELQTLQFESLLAEVSSEQLKDGVNETRAIRAGELVECCFDARNGETFWAQVQASSIEYQGGPATLVTLTDITELKELTGQLSFQASHDELTGLFNRRELLVRIQDAIHDSRRRGVSHSLLYVDLDQFKIVNDTCGHRVGDELLRQLVKRISSAVADSGVLARLGGDEFGVLLLDADEARTRDVAARILASAADFRFAWEDKVFSIGASVGGALIDGDVETVDEMLSIADAACYLAKDEGRNRLHFNAKGDQAVAAHVDQTLWVHRLNDALSEGRMRLYAQSINSLEHSTVFAREILIRLEDESGNLVSPGAFIPAAERFQLMPAVDRWVLNAVLRRIVADRSEYPEGERPRYFVNLSGQSLGDDSFRDYLVQTIEAHVECTPCLTLEITETAVISGLEEVQGLMRKLREYGTTFALDDFGSGLCSFTYLKQLDVDFIKIDGEFIRNVANSEMDRAVLETLVSLARFMRVPTVGEAIEDDETRRYLKEAGIDFGQGWFFDRPAPLAIPDETTV